MPNPSVGAVGAQGSGVALALVPVPAGVTTGKVVVVHASNPNSSNLSISGGNGTWELLAEYTVTAPFMRSWWKRATAADSGDYTLTGGASNTVSGVAARVDNDDGTATPFGTANVARSGSSSNLAAVSLAAADANANSMLFWAVACGNIAINIPPSPAGFVQDTPDVAQRVHIATLDNYGGGATGTVQGTLESGTATSTCLLVEAKAGASSLPDVIVGGAKKTVTAQSVVIGGTKKTITSTSVIVGGTKKAVV